MSENKRVTFILAKPQKRGKRVGIYCRVSTNSVEQLKSFNTQISELNRLKIVSVGVIFEQEELDISNT